MKKKKISKLFAGILVSALLAACGSSAAETPDPQAAVSGAGKEVFQYIAQQLVGTIDPAQIKDETEVIAAINLYDPLFYPDVENSSMSPVPFVAESYKVDDTAKIYTITIRDGIKFQSGNQLTAEDVAYTMERMIAINKGNAWLWSDVLEKVEATDEKTVEFTLNNPYAPFISTLTQLFIIDSQLLKDNQAEGEFGDQGDFGMAYIAENSAGSGPYKLVNWDRQSFLEFEAFEDYWRGWKEGQLKKVKMLTITEESTVKTLLVSGEADMIHQWLSVSAYEELKGQSGVVVEEDPSAKLQYFPMNMQKAPTDDKNVRKAIALAIDYTTALEDILGNSAAAAGAVPVIVPGASKAVLPVSQDLEAAKAALAKSGYAGQPIKVSFMYLGDTAQQRQFAQLFAANLAEIGIEVEQTPVNWAQVAEAAVSPETTANITVISDSLKYPHVDSHTYGIYHSSAKGSYRTMSWFSDPVVDEILVNARKAATEEEQMALYEESQNLVTAEYPAIYMANPTHYIAYGDHVEGYEFVGLMGYDVAFYSLSVK
ncbi:ABC transporter substrate-binding protein [Proteiniclasticum sp. SCR006]|uniref:ABC transporter substrate-binding protein n=1 Tax=Proteiniclasticum aestuarii TaxID=2817862 RepID=A0A939KG47_9CLOT|nr:ABC transporter substrate-binding protein [Proteiniclasticum aestuarii]MBO1265137.1 ABC transporter substrate-binding protein [Proteiniclasticum aestuarii]